jgi:hypothetical protein
MLVTSARSQGVEEWRKHSELRPETDLLREGSDVRQASEKSPNHVKH